MPAGKDRAAACRRVPRVRGKGKVDGCGCKQCKGSGRVIVSSEVVTYITAYDPEAETGKEGNDAV